MSTLGEKKRLQREQQALEVAAGQRTRIINTSAGLPMSDPKNAAAFAAEEERRSKAGEDSQALAVPDKGKAPATRSATANTRAPPRDVFMRDAIVSGRKRAASSEAPAAAKRQQLSVVLPVDQAALDKEYERACGLPEMERVGGLDTLYQRVNNLSLIYLLCS